MALPISRLLTLLDTELPNTGVIGYIALIQNVTHTGAFTIDTATDLITLSTTPVLPLATGCRFRITTTGTLPGVASGPAIATGTDYFWRVTTATTGRAYRTLDDALNNTNAIDFSNAGSGTLTFTEQILNATAANPDPLSVVLSKELPNSGGYSTRVSINNIGPSTIVSNGAEKTISFTLTGDATGYTYRFYQLIMGLSASSTIGNTNGAQGYLVQESANVTVNTGTPRFVLLRNRLTSP